MIRSMTGFGRCDLENEKYKISVEMKSVNHRYFDLSIRIPKKFNYFESAIRSLLKEYIDRGKVDLFISFEDFSENRVALKYNSSLAHEYMEYFKQMSEEFDIKNDISVASLARFPEIFSMEEVPEDEDEIWKLLEAAVRGAAEKFVEARTHEGDNLKNDLLSKLDYMSGLVDDIVGRSPSIVDEYRAKLEAKVKELLEEKSIDDGRIAAEVTIFADKICTDEETVRLRSHIAATKKELNKGGAVGRKLDFIAQEMNREANTILSKANDLTVSDIAIALKTEIEKVREQIQNIE